MNDDIWVMSIGIFPPKQGLRDQTPSLWSLQGEKIIDFHHVEVPK